MRLLFLFMMSFLFLFSKSQAKDHLFVVSGVVVNSGASKKIEDFVTMLSRKSGYLLKPFYVNSYTRLSEILRKYPDALAWTCGAPYVEDHLYDQQQLIAVPLFQNKPKYHSLIVTRKDSQKSRLVDFKDEVFVYSDLRSNSGYLAPSVLLKKEGFSMQDFFRVKILAGTHEKSIEAVYKGLADVAAIDEYVWVEYLKSRPHLEQELHVIEKTGPFPFTPIVSGKSIDKTLRQRLQKSLVEMNTSELEKFKEDFHMDGFVLKPDSFYDPIRIMFQEVKEVSR